MLDAGCSDRGGVGWGGALAVLETIMGTRIAAYALVSLILLGWTFSGFIIACSMSAEPGANMILMVLNVAVAPMIFAGIAVPAIVFSSPRDFSRFERGIFVLAGIGSLVPFGVLYALG